MDTKVAFQHPCRKTLDPWCFSHVTKIIEVFEFFSIWCWILLNVTQNICKCSTGRLRSRADVLLKKLWPNARKCFAQVETFWPKCKNLSIRVQKWKKGKVFPIKKYQKKLLDTRKAFRKSSLQKLLLKSINFFSENRKKTQNF